ncbi:MAG: cyclic nucleotide-binding domain-containing protein [Betaproteobacteria bacterium]
MAGSEQGGFNRSRVYDPKVALEFFRSSGKPEKIAKGSTIFAENDKAQPLLFKRDKMYLLLEGEVALQAGRKAIGTLRAGEIFGELAAIAGDKRTATATAATDCSVIGLDDKAFRRALAKQPSFALMLMSMIIGRIREGIAMLAERSRKLQTAWKEPVLFDKKQLEDLANGLSDDPPIYFDRNKVIVEEGQTGTRMYVVLKGRVMVYLDGEVVEKIGPGGVFGELALVDQPTRLASVVAETDCELLPIGRNAFLAMVKTSPDFAASLLSALSERLKAVTAKLK